MNLIFLPLLLLLAMTGVLTMYLSRSVSSMKPLPLVAGPTDPAVPTHKLPNQIYFSALPKAVAANKRNPGNLVLDNANKRSHFAVPPKAISSDHAGSYGHEAGGDQEEGEERDIWRNEKLMAAELGRRLEEKLMMVPEYEEMRATVHIKDGKDVPKGTPTEQDARNVAAVAKLVIVYGYRQPGRDVKESVLRDMDKAAKEAEKDGAHQGQAVHGAEHTEKDGKEGEEEEAEGGHIAEHLEAFANWKVPGNREIYDKENYLESVALLLRAMHEAYRVATFKLSLSHVKHILGEEKGPVNKLPEGIDLYAFQTSLWGILNLRMGDKKNVEKKARAVDAKILGGYNFASRLIHDFNIKNSDVVFDGKRLDKLAHGIIKRLQDSQKMVDETKEIVEKCESFIWNEPKLKSAMRDLKHTEMSQEEAKRIQEDLKKEEEKRKEKKEEEEKEQDRA